MHDIYKLKDLLMDELKEYGQKGELTAGSLDVVDKLAHSVKNICKIIEDCENEEYSGVYRGGSYRGGSYDGGMGGGSYARGGRGGGRRGGANQYGSYARGGGYSRAEDGMEDLLSEMHELMPMLPEEKRREAQRFVDKMRGM